MEWQKANYPEQAQTSDSAYLQRTSLHRRHMNPEGNWQVEDAGIRDEVLPRNIKNRLIKDEEIWKTLGKEEKNHRYYQETKSKAIWVR